MSKNKALILIALLSALATFTHADTLRMGTSENAARFEHAGKPSRGMSQARVMSDYGSPRSRTPAVGDPPISRWEYDNFVVFFEYDKVIHAVTLR